MKKIILISATIAITFQGLAQDKYVTTALTALKENNYDEAKDNIDKAMASPETKEKPKTLFGKVQIYFVIQNQDKYKAANPYREGAQALFKLVETKPDYEKETVDRYLINAAYLFFNDGVRAYNDKKYSESSDLMKNVLKVYEMKGRKYEDIKGIKTMDTIAAGAYQTMSNSAFYDNKYDEAIPLLIKVKNNPITKNPTAYECLIESYNKQKNTAEAYATIQEARKAFPDDVSIRNYELN